MPGIGPWTVHGFLIIALDRLDVMLPGDLAPQRVPTPKVDVLVDLACESGVVAAPYQRWWTCGAISSR